jgi:hypothetical protein
MVTEFYLSLFGVLWIISANFLVLISSMHWKPQPQRMICLQTKANICKTKLKSGKYRVSLLPQWMQAVCMIELAILGMIKQVLAESACVDSQLLFIDISIQKVMQKVKRCLFQKMSDIGLESITKFSKIKFKYLHETAAIDSRFLPYSSLFTFCTHSLVCKLGPFFCCQLST